MAEAEAPAEGNNGRSGIMRYALVGVALLAVIAGSIGGTLYFVGGSESSPADETETRPQSASSEGRLAPAVYHQIRPPFIINFVVGDKSRYLQADVTLMTRDPSVLDSITLHTPLIRDALIDVLSDQDYLLLQTEEGKTGLQKEMLRRVRELLSRETGRPGIEQIFITNFVMQ